MFVFCLFEYPQNANGMKRSFARFAHRSYSQSEMNCEKSFVMLNEVKHLGCAHVDVHEILHVRSG